MEIIRQDLCIGSIYIAFNFINSYIWEVLLSKEVSKINICSIKNLELDLLALFKACGTVFV